MHGPQWYAAQNVPRGGGVDASTGHNGDAPVSDIMGKFEIGYPFLGARGATRAQNGVKAKDLVYLFIKYMNRLRKSLIY